MKEHPDIRQFDSFATTDGGYEPVFNRSYAAAYELFSLELSCIVDQLRKPLKVVDIGCGDGWTAAFLASLSTGAYVGIDASGESVKALAARMRGNSRLTIYGLHQSAEWLLADSAALQVEALLGGFPSLIVCNTVIHQLRKTRCNVAGIICLCAGMLEIGGCFVLGDYYYPVDLSEEELNRAQQWIRDATGQNPTAHHVFWLPDDVRQVLRMTDLEVLACKETQANASIPLHYYLITAWRTM
jgi:SAM-dependent methyltransferase